MCSNPQTANDDNGNQLTFACRVCNDCITARKNDWIARGMAEMATSQQTLVINLTYRNNPDETLPDAAKAFRYSDVQRFLKHLRERYYDEYHTRNELRYVIAGERGSQKGRVHWHMIIWGDRPFKHLGQWRDEKFRSIPANRPGKIPGTNVYYRDHWSFWPHGHVTTDEPTQGTLAYVLKYALKDQFNIVKSAGTMREAKAENHGASYFRMSKVPPIGFRWLEKRCDEWEAKEVVPVTLQLKVPEYSGYWWPKAKQREYLLQRLHIINQKRNEKYRRDCPQWDALLASVCDSEKDWEGLQYGQIEEEKDLFDKWEWQNRLGEKHAPRIRERCGGALICRHCWHHQTRKERFAYWRWWQDQTAQYVTDTTSPEHQTFKQWYRAKRAINPFCLQKDEPEQQSAFCA
ncbi:hypothetical protein RUESEDTHA_03600 [Ruegeria sp. THAF57]|uniref:rolling circle replication-associated protein n=1 Tax=Ruegeria sp. THAF57 TaxID=2744555 RepID=UPI0015DFB88A|nr:hypothetical protein [Ruegeria sp. THAF57]CAD0186690.1 hypothetical protein RUESEDTHA_03600 [Ruegeria sp. THAF57]